MKKVTKCYGRKKTVVFKEKSFIRNFFDGNKSSDGSLFDISADKKLQEDSLSPNKENCPAVVGTATKALFYHTEDKENIASGGLDSPVLFQYSDHENLTKERLLDQSSFIIKNAKAGCAAKRVKRVKRNFRKKPKQVQHLSTKYYKSHQPRWSEFDNYNFTIEKKNYFFSVEQYKNKYCENKVLESISKKRLTGLRESTNTIDQMSNGYSKSHKLNVITSNSRNIPYHDSLDSSGDLFLQSCKKEKNVKMKKNKKHTINNDQNCATEFVEITEQVNKNNNGITNSEENEMNLNEHKKGAEPPEQLTNKSGLFERTENISLMEQCHESFKSGSSANLPELEELCQKKACRNSTNTSFIQNVEAEQINENISEILSLEVDFHSCAENSNNLFLQNDIKMKQINISNNDCSVSLPKEHFTEKDLIEKTGSMVLQCKINDEQKHCELSTINNFTTSKNSQSLKLRSSRSCKQLKSSSSLLVDNPFPNKENKIRNNQESVLSEVHSPTSKPVLKSTKLQIETLHSFSDQITDFSRGEGSAVKKINDTSKTSSMTDSTSNISNNFHCSNLLVNRRMDKFITSTPVMKVKTKNSINTCSLELTPLLNKNTKLIASDSNPEVDNCMFYNSANENCVNLDLENKESLLFEENSVACSSKKSVTIPKKISATSVSSKRNRSLLNLSSCSVPSSVESDEILKTKLLKLCNQDCIVSFDDIYKWKDLKIKKIGEGSYGEVFMISKGKSTSVLKIIPISRKSDDKYQELQSVLSEIQISKSLSELRSNKRNQSKNFVKVIKSSLVSGSYPTVLINAWDDFLDAKSCYNERPDAFDNHQLFAILELEYGGKDMSCVVLKNSVEAESILKQITVSLAVAEEEFLFEHRDLHLGNILVQRNRTKRISYKLRGKDISFASHGLHITVIDFTLSRLYKDGFIYYYDLADDKSLFEQSGDYQFEVYKYMRNHLGNQWQECSLYSNVLWLKYLCQKMKEFDYSRPSMVAHKRGLKSIESFNSHLMDCNCALECLTRCKITTHLFERAEIDSGLTKKSILVSRNSSKSKLSLCN